MISRPSNSITPKDTGNEPAIRLNSVDLPELGGPTTAIVRYEVATLMMLLKEYLRKELKTLMDNNIRFTAIGRVDGLDPS